MDYSWSNQELWQIRIGERDLGRFEQPYIGNGILGTRFGKLVVGTGKEPLCTLSRDVYDRGRQMRLPAWNHVFLKVGETAYTPESGTHRLEQVLDLRSGAVTLTDLWQYRPGKSVSVSAEMFIPRTFGHASYLSFRVSGLEEPATVRFGLLAADFGYGRMEFGAPENGVLTGAYRTAKLDRPVAQSILWKGEGLKTVSQTPSADSAEATAAAEGREFSLELFHAVQSPGEGGRPEDAVRKARQLCGLGRDALLRTSAAEWKRLWRDGLAFETDDLSAAKRLLAHQFYLLCSLETIDSPLGPLGLSKDGWNGTQFWDADFYVFRAVLPLWPDFARSIVDYRAKTLGKARELARVTGHEGAWYPWMTDEDGSDSTPARYSDELHVNIWIALAAWEYCCASGDRAYLREKAWPILSGIADFFASRLEEGRDGRLHLHCVVSPDESECESGDGRYRVGDSFLTNFGVRRVMEIAGDAARALGIAPSARWKDVRERIFLLPPDSDGVYPEYLGYDGHRIKQADVILVFYPLGLRADPAAVRANLRYYHGKTDGGGPLMTSQIESCLLMRLGDRRQGLRRLFDDMETHCRGCHFMPFECIGNDNSIMLTAIGGELQALEYGWYGAEIGRFENLPRIGRFFGPSGAES